MKTFVDGKDENLALGDFIKVLKEGKKIYLDRGDEEDNERINVQVNIYDKDPTGDKLLDSYKGEVRIEEVIRFCMDYPRGLRKYDFEIIPLG